METGVELAIKQKRHTFLNRVVAPFSDDYESFFFKERPFIKVSSCICSWLQGNKSQ